MDKETNLSKMADVTKTEEQEIEKSLDEEVEKTPHPLEADSGIRQEGDSSTSGTVHSTENEKDDTGKQDSTAKRKNLDPGDEPPKKIVSIICFEPCSHTCFKALAKEKIENICAKHL